MKEGQQQIHTWDFPLAASPAELWPYISDTNRIFRKLGATPVEETSLSRSTSKGFLELSHSHLQSYVTWKEEPYNWEIPYHYRVVRQYKLGMLKDLKIDTQCIKGDDNTRLRVKIIATPKSIFFSFIVKAYINSVIKRKLTNYLEQVVEAISKNLKPYEFSKPKKLVRGAEKKLIKLERKLVEASKRKRIVNRLIEFIRLAEDEDLTRIHPYVLAQYWGEKKYSVLNVFLNATKLDLLDFSWDVCCPSCKAPRHTFHKMKEARVHLYCEECDLEYSMDFNKNMHLVFRPHPLIRKVSGKKYCLGGPGNTPHRVLQNHLIVGDERYPQLKLNEGTYLFKTYNHEGFLKLHVRENGADNVNIYITDDDLNGEEITISQKPNLAIHNHSSKKVLCYIDKVNWKQEAIYASEVCSTADFTSLFSRETLKDTSKVNASEITLLFTDLMNSTQIYVQEGDESAIGRVMGHFKIIQQIIAEERGGIVKTIGDSVMAVFTEPVSALKAVKRIQEIFSTDISSGDGFKLKAGVHYGDCTALSLNGRIDYFGTTVNIASRLVDVASEKEIMVSEAVYNHPDVQLYLEKFSDTFFVKESLKELKGFSDEEFKVKQIRLERPPMRLVI